MVDASFREEGSLIWVDLGPEWPGFTEALNDGVSCLSPLGQPAAVSTYWIDHALAQLSAHPGEQVTGGNITYIERTPGGVRACSEYEEFDDQEMVAADFVAILQSWRQRVEALHREGDPSRPKLAPYQRNPFP